MSRPSFHRAAGHRFAVYDFPTAPVFIGLVVGLIAEIPLYALTVSESRSSTPISAPVSSTAMGLAVAIIALLPNIHML